MQQLFLKLVNLSISASVLVVAVILLRYMLQRAPKWVRCFLWAFVAVRLLIPFSFESNLSLAPRVEVVQVDESLTRPYVNSGIERVDASINSYIGVWYSQSAEEATAETVSSFDVIGFFSKVWLIGVVGLLAYALFSYGKVYRSVRISIRSGRNVYECDDIEMPFILGVIRPTIYLPSGLTKTERANVLAHERAHIKRGDFLWKPLGFLLLAVYWFNPLIWAAYILLCRDIEMACDEMVVANMTVEQKKQYSWVLLSFCTPRKVITVCPLAFGEVGVKERVKGVLHYRKPTIWILLAAVAACLIITICFLTSPKEEKLAAESTELVESESTATPKPEQENATLDVSRVIPPFDAEEEISKPIPSLEELSFIVLGQRVSLPGNENWVRDIEYQVVSENELVVRYYDVHMQADCELHALRGDGELELPTLGNPGSENWSGINADGKYILVPLQIDEEAGTVLATWTCGDCHFALIGKDVVLDKYHLSDSLAKTALHIVHGLGTEVPTEKEETGNYSQEFTFSRTKFQYGGKEYDVNDWLGFEATDGINSVTRVGDTYVLQCHVGPQDGLYVMFNPAEPGAAAYVAGTNMIWRDDDLSTAVLSNQSGVYSLIDGELLKSYDLAENEFISDLSFSASAGKLVVTISGDDGKRTDLIEL